MRGEPCLAPLCTSLQEITPATLPPLLTLPHQLSPLHLLCLLHLLSSLLQIRQHFTISLQCTLPPPPSSLLLQLKIPWCIHHQLHPSPLQLHSHFPLILLLLFHLPPPTFLPSPLHIPQILLKLPSIPNPSLHLILLLPLRNLLHLHLHLPTLTST